jgi:hypothetical protein
MHSLRLFPLALAFAAAACATQQPASRAPELSIEFTFTGVQPCTNVSPRIVVRDVPPAAKRLRVELVDTDTAFARHGVSEVEVPRDGVLAPGALKSYRGPCISQQAIVYELRVEALDEGGRVVARGAEKAAYEPGNLRQSIRRARQP